MFWYNIILEIFLLSGIFLLLIFCLIIKKYTYLSMYTNSNYLSILLLVLILFLLYNNSNSIYILWNLDNIHFYSNDLIVLIKYLILFNFLIIFFLSFTYKFYIYEYSIILLLCLFSVYMLISSIDLIGIYLTIELQSFCFYILTSLKTYSNFSLEAGLKYFILGSFSSSLFIFGISLIYGVTNLLNVIELQLFLNSSIVIINFLLLKIGVIFLLVSLLFKLGLVPFHMYIPDVYSGAPSIITFLFIILQKLVIITLFFFLYINIFKYFQIQQLLIFCIICSILFGSLMAISQSKIKRLLAYSTIVNSGYLLSGVVVGSLEGFISSFSYLFIYIILMFGIFIIFLSVRNQVNYNKLVYIRDFILLKKSNNILTITFALLLFSLAGFPPLVGFYSKLFIFISTIKEFYFLFSLIIIFCTALTIFYYIRIIKIIYFEQQLKFGFFLPILKINALLIFPIIFFNLFFGINSKFIINLFEVFIMKIFLNF